MSVSLKFIAPGITADGTNSIATWLPRLQRHATLCSGGLRMPTAIEILHVSQSSICLFRPPLRCRSNNFRLHVGLLVSWFTLTVNTLTGNRNRSPVNTTCTGQSFTCLQSQNTNYRTYKTTLKMQVKCNYYANIASVMTCGI